MTTTLPTTWSRATSRCNSASWHHRRLILVSRYLFLTMLSWLEQVSELPDVHQHQQNCQQHGPGPLKNVTHLPGIVESWSWFPDICFWLSWVDSNRYQNCLVYTNNNMVTTWSRATSRCNSTTVNMMILESILSCYRWLTQLFHHLNSVVSLGQLNLSIGTREVSCQPCWHCFMRSLKSKEFSCPQKQLRWPCETNKLTQCNNWIYTMEKVSWPNRMSEFFQWHNWV